MIERLQKIISASGLMSRRAAEKLIGEGQVCVNGIKAGIGDKADPETDSITMCLSRKSMARWSATSSLAAYLSTCVREELTHVSATSPTTPSATKTPSRPSTSSSATEDG